MDTELKLTSAQQRTLRVILDSGGLWPGQLHMGRLAKRPGTANKLCVERLESIGLVERVPVTIRDERRGVDVQSYRYCATAKGCLAMDASAAAVLTKERMIMATPDETDAIAINPGIVVYGPRTQGGGHNLGVRIGAVDVLLSPDDEDAQGEAEALAARLVAVGTQQTTQQARIQELEAEVASLRATLARVRAEATAAETRALAATAGRRRFFGPVLMVPVRPGDWGGEVWLQDPEKRDRGHALRFADLAEVRRLHPELWVVGTTADGVLLDAWGRDAKG